MQKKKKNTLKWLKRPENWLRWLETLQDKNWASCCLLSMWIIFLPPTYSPAVFSSCLELFFTSTSHAWLHLKAISLEGSPPTTLPQWTSTHTHIHTHVPQTALSYEAHWLYAIYLWFTCYLTTSHWSINSLKAGICYPLSPKELEG